MPIAEAIAELQALVTGIYERSGYDHCIDSLNDPTLPLTPEELTWVNNVLTQQRRR